MFALRLTFKIRSRHNYLSINKINNVDVVLKISRFTIVKVYKDSETVLSNKPRLHDGFFDKHNTKSTLKNSSLIFYILGTVRLVYTFLENIPIRHDVLENIANESG